MKANSLKILSIAFLAISLAVVSCKKSNTDSVAPDNQAQNVENIKLALKTNLSFINSFTNGVANKDKAQTNQGGKLQQAPQNTCPAFTLAYDTIGGWGVALGYDYGTGCPNDIALGIIRKGKVTYKYFLSNNLTNAIDVMYQNFQDSASTFNGVIKSTYQYTNLGSNYFLGSTNLSINNTTFGNSVYETSLYYKQQQGAVTLFVSTDDVYHITGSTAINNSITGLAKFEVLTPLVNKLNCNYIVSGRAKITLGTTVAIIDFGNGNCDNMGTMEINGIIFPILF
jgi:hypothetical protein